MTHAPSRASGPWGNDNLLKKLKELWDQEIPYSRIAKLLNEEFGTTLTNSTISGKVSRMGMAGNVERRARISKAAGVSHKKKAPIVVKTAKPPPPKPVASARPSVPYERAAPFVASNPPIGLMALTSQTCKWPVNDGPDWLFCGAVTHTQRGHNAAATDKQSPYCEHHHAVSFYPAKARKAA